MMRARNVTRQPSAAGREQREPARDAEEVSSSASLAEPELHNVDITDIVSRAVTATQDRSAAARPPTEEADASVSRLQSLRHHISKFWHDFVVLDLENVQSVARDHLANERTYLAYVRTSLTFSSAGITIAQLFRLSVARTKHDGNLTQSQQLRFGKALGAAFISISILIGVLGLLRFFHTQNLIARGYFPVSTAATLVVAFCALFVSVFKRSSVLMGQCSIVVLILILLSQ